MTAAAPPVEGDIEHAWGQFCDCNFGSNRGVWVEEQLAAISILEEAGALARGWPEVQEAGPRAGARRAERSHFAPRSGVCDFMDLQGGGGRRATETRGGGETGGAAAA